MVSGAGESYQRVKHTGAFLQVWQDVHVPSFSVLEDSNYPSFTHKVIDLEESDKETIHLLVFLLMQFLSRSDQVNLLPTNNASEFQVYIYSMSKMKRTQEIFCEESKDDGMRPLEKNITLIIA
ncbi:hypothetical protein TSAR_007984 [Trichomalopsis sarcophagae]|uniref:Uncharacterized protein n=1 Tax=Trichomalopsis sarcophagae TaxID=543379 RepID=A0A232FNU8_9HYME|nr:hypothetical protein TSAR_007984 [Trichomalopsis sarcophagae]